MTGGSSRPGRRTAPSACCGCSRRRLQRIAARGKRSPGRERSLRGELDVAEEIRRRFVGGGAARDVKDPAAAAAARAAGQAAAVAHMGAHALGAAAYAAKAAALAAPDQHVAVEREVGWQLDHMSAAVKVALRLLPPLGEDRAGPLGPGLLASGLQGAIIRSLQAGLTERCRGTPCAHRDTHAPDRPPR